MGSVPDAGETHTVMVWMVMIAVVVVTLAEW